MNLIIREEVALAPHTTMGVGGNARYFTEVTNEEEVLIVADFARERKLPVFVLGGGSNIVISESGFNGLVVANKIKKFEVEKRDGKIYVTVGAGENWDETIRRTVELGLGGLETLSGIPGTVGGAPVQNIGAYGTSVDATISSIRVIDIESNNSRSFSNAECEFGYRTSIFKLPTSRKHIITEVTFKLEETKESRTPQYQDLKVFFGATNNPPTILEVRKAVIEIRAKKGMVIMPEYESYRSVGSFFKNPIISKDAFIKIKNKVDAAGIKRENPWFWELGDGTVKISGAFLIEESGFTKGHREGKVGISPKHTLALINNGNATTKEILLFAQKIQDAIYKKFEVIIEPEAELIGFDINPILTKKF